MKCENAVIIVAGGKGLRFGNEMPKQFLLLDNKPLLMHTIESFSDALEDICIVVVLPKSHQKTWFELCEKYQFRVAHKVCDGGSERFFSVKNGLNLIDNCNIVGVHDGVRPLISKELIKKCFSAVEDSDGVIPVVSPVESVRKGTFEESCPINRDDLWLVQTPQVFKFKLLQDAYNTQYKYSFTDDASVFENEGYKVSLIEGERSNIKVTHKNDLQMIEYILQAKDL